MTITGSQLNAALANLGIPPYVISEPSDAVYMPCRSDWLCGDYHKWFLNHCLPAFDIRDYQPEGGDCDDFVDLFNSFARITHRRTPEGKGTALPVGRLNFLKVPDAPIGPAQKKHALGWAYTSDKGIVFPEPQVLYRIKQLTVPQLNSATRCSD